MAMCILQELIEGRLSLDLNDIFKLITILYLATIFTRMINSIEV